MSRLQTLHEFSDVSAGEKRFMQLWNTFMGAVENRRGVARCRLMHLLVSAHL